MRLRGHGLLSAVLIAAGCVGTAGADESGLTRAEAEARAPRLARHFERIDADGDGRITAREVRAWRKAGRARGRDEHQRGRFDELFRRADADRDGALSRDEAAKSLPRIARKFDRIDADRDGRLTLDEAHAWLDARRAARAGATRGGSAK